MTPGDDEGLDEEVAQEASAEMESGGWPKEGRPAGNAERRDEDLADLEVSHAEMEGEEALGTRRSLGWPKEGRAR